MANFIIGDYRYTILDNNNVRAMVVDTTKTTYQDIPSQVTYDNVVYDVTDMYRCFEHCTSLINAPIIPNGVISIRECFIGCTALTTPPVIPNSVTNIYNCFIGCTSLTTPPIIPNGVTNMSECFRGCTSLTTPPVIPNGVRDMSFCFRNCTSLTIAPVIPNSVTNMDSCFNSCTSLTTSPVIPNSVTSMGYCFNYCTNLEGDVYVYAKNITYKNAFFGTNKPIVIHAMNDNTDICQLLATTANNNNAYVNVHPEEEITFVDTEMKYKNGDKTETLSLQTNANLVQCEIPDLVNGGTITTNVNDALIDLYKRGVFD